MGKALIPGAAAGGAVAEPWGRGGIAATAGRHDVGP